MGSPRGPPRHGHAQTDQEQLQPRRDSHGPGHRGHGTRSPSSPPRAAPRPVHGSPQPWVPMACVPQRGPPNPSGPLKAAGPPPNVGPEGDIATVGFGSELRTAPAKREAAPLRKDFFPLWFVYISLRQLQHRRKLHSAEILPLASFPPGPRTPGAPPDPPRARPGRARPCKTAPGPGVPAPPAAPPPLGDSFRTVPQLRWGGGRARCPRRGPEGRGARAAPLTGTPPPRGTARSRPRPLTIGGDAHE
ncbi:basic proline-rich protein-like [Poecile atricapillus]|uniref:basic proline-rich protein-like n=1 Tax=Poecile atricapillus TaxID=48891 RepID=UPI0027385868|nr:basic proline-rich protein-like [Poecile atricapillus]